MSLFQALLAALADALGLGYQGRRRRPEGQPFGFYPGTAPLVWPNV